MPKYKAKKQCTVFLGVKNGQNNFMSVEKNQIVDLPENVAATQRWLIPAGKGSAPKQEATGAYTVDVTPPKENPLKEPPKEPKQPSCDEERQLDIQTKIDKLRKSNSGHWNKDGSVNISQLSKMVGYEVTAEEVEAACPGFNQASAK